MEKFTTIADAAQHIETILDSSEGEYDVQAIAEEVYEYRVERDENGAGSASTAGLYEREGIGFWEIAAKHAK